jgi:hypothetical protein
VVVETGGRLAEQIGDLLGGARGFDKELHEAQAQRMRQRADFGDASRERGRARPFTRSIRWHRGTVPRTWTIDKEDLNVQYYLNNHPNTPSAAHANHF